MQRFTAVASSLDTSSDRIGDARARDSGTLHALQYEYDCDRSRVRCDGRRGRQGALANGEPRQCLCVNATATAVNHEQLEEDHDDGDDGDDDDAHDRVRATAIETKDTM